MTVHGAEDRVEQVLPELYALTPIERFPRHALDVVKRVVPGDKGEYTEVDLRTGDFRVLVDPEPPELHALGGARRQYMAQHPVMRHFLHEDDPAPRKISDFLSSTEFHRLGLYGEFFRYVAVEDQLTVTISTRVSGRPAGISVDRGSGGFDDRDRSLMTRLRPHLVAARRNAMAFSRALVSASTARPDDSAALDRLTSRQREILDQLSRGRTNAEIAIALDISPETVRKHVENIRLRLEVPNRTAAAAYYLTRSSPTPPQVWTDYVPTMHADVAVPATMSAGHSGG